MLLAWSRTHRYIVLACKSPHSRICAALIDREEQLPHRYRERPVVLLHGIFENFGKDINFLRLIMLQVTPMYQYMMT